MDRRYGVPRNPMYDRWHSQELDEKTPVYPIPEQARSRPMLP